MVKLELYEFKNICADMAELGVINYIKSTAPGKDEISQREAWRLFGETKVKNWVSEGLVQNRKRSGKTKRSKIIYSKAELMAIQKSRRINEVVFKNSLPSEGRNN